MKTLDQLRAARAYATMAAADEDTLSRARALPAMLHLNGLLAVWAFFLAKNLRQPPLLGELLAHFQAFDPLQPIPTEATPYATFLAWVGTAEAPGLEAKQLRDLTAEAVAFSGWLKRAAEARVPSEASPGDREGRHG